MRTATIASLLSLATAVLAQDLSGLPVCAQTAAITAATSSGCGLSDASCLCNSAGFIASLKATISGSCTGSDQQTACAWGNSACVSFGVSIDCNLAAASPSSSAVPNTSTMPTDVISGSGFPSDSGTASMTSSATGSGDVTGASSGMSSAGSMATDVMMSSMTTSTMLGNGTMACSHGCGNMTHAATSMVSRTGSAPTSQYTGTASTAARHSGVIGVVLGAAFILAFF